MVASYGGDTTFYRSKATSTVAIGSTTCSRLSGTVVGTSFTVTVSDCVGHAAGDLHGTLSGTIDSTTGVVDWAPSGSTTELALGSFQPGTGCPTKDISIGVTGTVTGGTSTTTQEGDAAVIPVCVNPKYQVSLPEGDVVGL